MSERLAEIEAREIGVIEEELARAIYDEDRDLEPAEASNQAARLLSLCPNLLAVVSEDAPWLLEQEKKLREGFAIEYEWRHVETCGCKRRAALRTPDSGCKLPLPRALADSGEASGEAD